MSYVDRPLVFGTIIASFFLIALPLGTLQMVPNDFRALPYLVLVQAVFLGVSHFFITLALYGDRDNLRYFNGSAKNRAVYFGVPLLCFAFFGVSSVLGLAERNAFSAVPRRGLPWGVYFFPALRILDFVHVGRQSFGVTQLLKRAAAELPRRQRTLENLLFFGLALLEFQTFLGGGRFHGDDPTVFIPAGLVALMFVAVVIGYVNYAEEAKSAARVWRPVLYVTLQALSAAAAVYRTRLYLVALSMHYVEYHLLMAPRLFPALRAPLTPATPGAPESSAPARRYGALHVAGFYLLLLAVVVLFQGREGAQARLSPSVQFMVHVFDGIFVFHYFIEAFVWKFTNPFYRGRLAPLYLTAEGAASDGPRSYLLPRAVIAAAVLGVLGVYGLLQTDALGAPFRSRILAPLRSEQHLNFGIDLAEKGQISGAGAELRKAMEEDPGNRNAAQALRDLELLSRTPAPVEAAP